MVLLLLLLFIAELFDNPAAIRSELLLLEVKELLALL